MAAKTKKETFNVRDTFLALTSYTYPHGNEHRLKCFLPEGVTRDRHGNYIYQIGNSRTIFACHLDTVSSKFTPVVHVFDGDMIKTDGNTTLGADDKAGVTILLYLIHNRIPGTYYFFIGEECGCIGSKAAAKDGNFENFDRIVSFDRRNTCSIITYQQGARCCSNDFAEALSKEYNTLGLALKPDDTGVVTDSAQFTGLIPECTNISVGYYSEHTSKERQDIAYLERLCEASIKINWETLPTARDPKLVERKTYKNDYSNNSYCRFPRETYTHHGKPGKGRRYNDFSQGSLFNHSYNTTESSFDEAFEADMRRLNKQMNKQLKKDKKKGKKQDKYDISRFGDLTELDPTMIDDLLNKKADRDIYLPFREFLVNCAWLGEPNLLSQEEYAIIEENKVNYG